MSCGRKTSWMVGGFLLCTLGLAMSSPGAPVEPLWPGGVPDSKGDADADNPTLTLFPADPDKANGVAVVICPGGGYHGLAMDYEGYDVTRWLNSEGISAFVVKYRLHPYRHPVPLQDAQRAIRIVRTRAAEWKVDPGKIGILGFSAGGHLASTAATHFDAGDAQGADPIARMGCRPDFAVLLYPVITMTDPYTHRGSRKGLLGEQPSEAQIDFLSNEKRITPATPPTFLVHTFEDKAVPAENSILFYRGLRDAGVPGEPHIFERGRHGLGLGSGDPAFSAWPKACIEWFRTRGLIR